MKTMKFWLVALAMLAAVGAWGQGWIKTYGFENTLYSQTGVSTLDGGLLIAYAVSNVPHVTLRKVDTDGNIVFEKQLMSSYEEFSFDGLKGLDDGTFMLFGKAKSLPPNNLNLSRIPAIIKIDSSGNKLWESQIPLEPSFPWTIYCWARELTFTDNGDIVLSGDTHVSLLNEQMTFLAKLNSQGELLWQKNFHTTDYKTWTIGHILIDGEHIVLSALKNDSLIILKTDYNGNIAWENKFDILLASGSSSVMLKVDDSNFIIAGRKEFVFPEPPIPYSIKLNSQGEKIWEIEYSNLPDLYFSDAIVALDEEYYFCGSVDANSASNFFLTKWNVDGSLDWFKNYDIFFYEYPEGVFQLQDSSIRIIGSFADPSANNFGAFIAKTDANGNLYTSALSGHIHHDPELDCLPDPTEPGRSGWLVQATGTQSFATLTDSIGNFTLPVDTGSYTVTIAPPGPYWEVCNSPATVAITAFYDTLSLDFPAQAIVDCPYLTVDISAPFLRRCFDNNYYVHYCNDGTATANDATVEVTLDPYFTYVSSTLPLASQNGNTLSFDLGDVAVGDCGSFQVTAHLDCDSTILGQTHCTSAHITPDSLCLQPDPLWDGSSIEVDVSCSGDTVVFTITNVGMGGMPAPLGYIIIEDQIVLMTDEFQLGPGQSTSITLPATGGTFRLEAQQAPEHPSGFASTGATIEGCGGWMSLGFFTQWAFDDDPDPFTDVDCQANVGSFDPNDKQGFPAGFTEEHLIEPGQDIEYLIRFQNTGTDTAFKVTVVDVLPPELDLASVRPGASSHPYTYGVTPEGWLTFTFNDIMLPDSNTNEAASHGFVRFRASQRPGLGWGNVIANTALIYFDFNAPVQTNTYQHRIGQVFPWTLVGTTPPVFHPKTQVRIVPNPLTDSALLQVEGLEPGPLRLVLTDVSGKVLRQQTVNGTGFEFQRGELNPGLYFFKIDRNGEQVGSGKLMVK